MHATLLPGPFGCFIIFSPLRPIIFIFLEMGMNSRCLRMMRGDDVIVFALACGPSSDLMLFKGSCEVDLNISEETIATGG
jgi:hypothetical protein